MSKIQPEKAARRTFSTELKQAIVNDIENKLVRVADVIAEYNVSRSAVYKWIARFGRQNQKPHRVVLELDSEQYQTKELRKRLLELEATIGRKQLELDYLSTLISVSSDALGIDLKKTFAQEPSRNSENTTTNRSGE
jgi:transposase-like protein